MLTLFIDFVTLALRNSSLTSLVADVIALQRWLEARSERCKCVLQFPRIMMSMQGYWCCSLVSAINHTLPSPPD